MAQAKPTKPAKPAKPAPPRSRRREVRKAVGPVRPGLRAVLSRRDVGWGIAFMALFFVLASLLVLHARSEIDYRPGQVIDDAVVSRVSFQWINQERTEDQRDYAAQNAPAVYKPNPSYFERVRQTLLSLPVVIGEAQTIGQVPPETANQFGLNNNVLSLLRQFRDPQEGKPTAEWQRMVDQLLSALRWAPVVRQEQYQQEKQPGATRIKLMVNGNEPRPVSEDLLINLANDEARDNAFGSLVKPFPDLIESNIIAYLKALREPSYALDTEATKAQRQAARLAVEPIPFSYEQGDVLVDAGAALDPADIAKIERETTLYLAQKPAWQRWLTLSGAVFIVLVITFGLGVSVLALRPRIAENPMRGLAFTALLLGTLALAWAVEPAGAESTTAAAAGCAMLAAVILVIAYNQALAIAVGVIHAALIAFALELSVGLTLVVMTGCVLAVLQLRQIRQRGTLIRAGLVTGLIIGAATFAVGAAERNLSEPVLLALGTEAAMVLVAAVAVGFFVLGILPFVERAFKVTTAMTLLELSDVNQPLLRRLAQTAPGTYNHSLNLAVIAEAAAEAIGVDGLLCRVAAYYHDIGKMNKPSYFIENQGGGPNRHDKLSPAMSLLIIVGHVKDGIEMAREYGLPPVLVHFIESHHGTTLVEYFYHAAMQKRSDDKAQPSEFEYRYPGPKPQTKEAAILMLCDTVESACRSMAEPTASRIEQLVHKLAMKRLMDGQFDQSNLTLEELHRIEESVSRSLAGIYHGRIKYPSGEKKQPEDHAQQPAAAAAG